jgi:hypothetical protein
MRRGRGAGHGGKYGENEGRKGEVEQPGQDIRIHTRTDYPSTRAPVLKIISIIG